VPQRAHEVARQAVVRRERLHDLSVFPRGEAAAVGADPERAGRIAKERVRELARQSVRGGDPLDDAPAAPADHARAERRDPEAAVAVVFELPQPIDGQTVAHREARHAFAVDAQQTAARRGDVERAVARGVDLADAIGAEELGVERFDAALAQAGQTAAVRADPERAVRRFEERGDEGGAERGRGLPVEHDEPHPVEPHEPFLGADPEIAVARLHGRVDAALRQAGLGRPDGEPRLRQRARRIERDRRRGDAEREEEAEDAVHG
jgi:hypothetical protein